MPGRLRDARSSRCVLQFLARCGLRVDRLLYSPNGPMYGRLATRDWSRKERGHRGVRPRHPDAGAPLRSATQQRVPQSGPGTASRWLRICWGTHTPTGDWAAACVVASSRSSRGGGGIDLPTLVITAVASAAAAYTCSKIWAPGTLASAAFMPVLVALLKE